MADAWGGSWGVAWGTSWTSSGVPVVVVTAPARKRPGPHPGAYAQRYYLPPGWKTKKPRIEEVKDLYVEARKEIPPKEQRGLLPARFRLEGHSVARLPPARLVDFESLRSNIEAIRPLLEALGRAVQERARAEFEAREAEAHRIKRRKRDEETLILLLLDL